MCERNPTLSTLEGGLDGDHAGKRKARLVTAIEREGWREACAALSPPADPEAELPWLTRRANLLVEGASLPKAVGGVFRVGDVVLEITGQTNPCSRMEEARAGLIRSLGPDWRGGVTCTVIEEGDISVGDEVTVLVAPPRIERKLP
ncbi:MAG: MOSC domain-containing protein [Pseudomonadota bacterium]